MNAVLAQKEKAVEDLKDGCTTLSFYAAAHYRGMDVTSMTALEICCSKTEYLCQSD